MLLQKSNPKKPAVTKDAETVFKKGLMLLQDKLYKQAMIELKIALERNQQAVQPELETLFIKHEGDENKEKALTIGLVLFQVKKEEKLAITLGNYSRKLGNYKQANNLYRQALKINRSSILAFYNLAASMGHVEWYDHDVSKLISQFFKISDYVFPEPLNSNETIRTAESEVRKIITDNKNRNIDRINKELQAKQSNDQKEEFEALNSELEALIEQEIKVESPVVIEFLLDKIGKKQAQDLDEEESDALYIDMFNLGLYALKHKNVAVASEQFQILKNFQVDFEDLDQCIGLSNAVRGAKDKAIDILTRLIRSDKDNRLLNINLALLHRRTGNRLLAYKFQIIAASLLEKSLGLIYKSEIVKQADVYFRNDQLDKALKLYKIVAYESNDIKAWMNIGDIHLLRKRQLEALDAFREIQKRYPDSPIVKNKLKEVHDIICHQADELFNNSKFSQSSVLYERALKLARTSETIERLISVYKRLNKHNLVQSLYEEQQHLSTLKREENKLEKRQELIEDGKKHMKNQDFESAIYSFESAFNIKPDKDVFAYLAHIYKGLKRKRMLKDLVERWNDHETKLAINQKPKEVAEAD